MLLQAALFGFIGGLARACVGFTKYSLNQMHSGLHLLLLV